VGFFEEQNGDLLWCIGMLQEEAKEAFQLIFAVQI
jgi:hypothetical protein